MEIPVKKNETYVVDIIDQGYEGEAIAKIHGYTIFIPGAIKEEKCKILILKITNWNLLKVHFSKKKMKNLKKK